MYSYKFPICTVNPVRRSPHESGVIDDWELFYVKSCLRRAKIDFFLSHLSVLFIYAGNNFFAGGPIKLDVV